MKELQRKRHSATPGVSFRGRVRKAAKCQPASDEESDEESESKFKDPSLIDPKHWETTRLVTLKHIGN